MRLVRKITAITVSALSVLSGFAVFAETAMAAENGSAAVEIPYSAF